MIFPKSSFDDRNSPYPKQVAFLLARQLDLPFHPGMSKEEIANERLLQIAKKTKMRFWQCIVKRRFHLDDLLTVCQDFGRYPYDTRVSSPPNRSH
jgi:hypothetical protein